MLEGNFVNMYFGLCLLAWVVSVVIVVLAIIIPPFRRLCVKITYNFYKKLYLDLFVNILGDIFTPEELKEVTNKLYEIADDLKTELDSSKKKEEENHGWVVREKATGNNIVRCSTKEQAEVYMHGYANVHDADLDDYEVVIDKE